MSGLKKLFSHGHKDTATAPTTSHSHHSKRHDQGHGETGLAATESVVTSHSHHGKRHEVGAPSTGLQTVTQQPVHVEKHVNAPVVQEVRRSVETEVVQPVVQRDVEVTKIEQVIQPIVDRQVAPEMHQQIVEPVREVVRGSHELSHRDKKTYERTAHLHSTVVDKGVERSRIVEAPIVTETVRASIRQEVTPVVQREVVIPRVIHHEKPVHETIIERPVLTQTTLPAISAQEAAGMGIVVPTHDLSQLHLSDKTAKKHHGLSSLFHHKKHDTTTHSSKGTTETHHHHKRHDGHDSAILPHATSTLPSATALPASTATTSSLVSNAPLMKNTLHHHKRHDLAGDESTLGSKVRQEVLPANQYTQTSTSTYNNLPSSSSIDSSRRL